MTHRPTQIEQIKAVAAEVHIAYQRFDAVTIRKVTPFAAQHIDIWRDGEAAPSYLGVIEYHARKGWGVKTAMGTAKTKTDVLRIGGMFTEFDDALAELLKHKSDRPVKQPWDLAEAEKAGMPPLGEQHIEVWIADPGHGDGFNAYWAGNACEYCAPQPLDPHRLRPVACHAPRQHAEMNVGTWRSVTDTTAAHVRTITMSRAELLTAYGTAEQAAQAVKDANDGSAAGLILLPHSGLRVPHAKLTVTSLKQFEMSRGVAYTATLRLGGTIVGTIENEGCGGETMFQPRPGAGFGYDDLNAYAGQCHTVGGWNSTESVLNDLVDEYETARLVAKNTKAGKITCRLLRRVADDSTDTYTTDYATLKAERAPRTPEEQATLGRNCHRLTPATPGQSWWQVWEADAQRWIYLPGTVDIHAETETGR